MKLSELQVALVSRRRNRLGFARTVGVAVPFLGHELCPINFDEFEVSDPEAERVVGAFLQLNGADRQRLSAPVFEHYQASVRAMAGEYDDESEMLGGKQPPVSPEDVWRLVTGSDLMVRKENGVLYVLLVSDCEWELDHGFCMIFRHGTELVRVGDLTCDSLEEGPQATQSDFAAHSDLGMPAVISYERM